MSQYLSEAFKRLDTLNEDTFAINDNGLEDFVKFEEEDEFEDAIDVIDPEATTIDELQDSYIGKVILDCCVCHSKLYKDVEDVVIEDDIANANEECPFCYTTDGYRVIGQVASFGEEEEEENKEHEDTKEEPKDEDNTEIEEGLFGKKKDKEKGSGTFKVVDGQQKFTVKGGFKTKDDAYDWIENNKEPEEYSKYSVLAESVDESETIEESFKIVDRKTGFTIDNGFTTEKDALNEIEDKYQSEIGRYKVVRESVSIQESVNNVNVETDEDIINVSTDDNGRVTVSTEPIVTTIDNEGEMIAPLEPEVQSEISDNVGDGEEIEIDMDEFDEESFDTLGEGYLKKVYENVNSFKTSNVLFVGDKLIVEGVINFASGNSKKTNFAFGMREATKSGKVRFIGENKEIARGRKSFTITGRVENKKFLSESFNYNYGVKGANGKTQRLYGTIKNKRG